MTLSDEEKRKLRDAFSAKASVNGNMLNFIGLDDVRAKFPAMWEKSQERMVATTRSILAQFTDPKVDIVLPSGEANFVVLFTRLGKDEAMLRAAAIKAELVRRFVGDDALAGLDVQVQAMELDSGSMTSGTLSDMLAAARPSGPPAAGREDPKERQRQIYRSSIGELGAAGSMPLDVMEQRFGFRLDDLDFAFQPYYYVKRGVFSIFKCRAVRYGATGDILTGYGVLPRDATADQIVAVDEMTLMRARHGLVDMAVRKRVAVVVVPVSFETMTNRATAAEYLGLLQKIPSDLRNYLVVDVNRAPVGVPEGRLSEIIGPLRRLTRAAFVRVYSARQSLSAVKGAGAFGIGFSIPTRPTADFGSPAAMGRFAAAAHKLGLQAYVCDVETAEQAADCRAAGFDYLAGRAVAELSDYVGPVSEMQIA